MPIVMLLGPTAAGKTATAMALAELTPCHLISMDSAMVYRGMDIGTAKPDAATLATYPHALIDICDPAETYSAAAFVEDADGEVVAACRAGKLPVLVGGAMLYARAFRDGLAELPQASEAIRAAISARAAAVGWAALHERLAGVDPEAAAAIHPNNPQRLQRALEVYESTGRPISVFWREQAHRGVQNRLGALVEGTGRDVSERVDARVETLRATLEQARAAIEGLLEDRGQALVAAAEGRTGALVEV
ncbi:MAG: tRNA (adenosine(37)-N6)-dimethylallyltransferase MiaA, partial [Gammaproteobacteria bacterium]|nr:tRNA (adenosine(37)-N6)-dimethylallyltransferase MiaA [Gammaproteobacteria bacterium]